MKTVLWLGRYIQAVKLFCQTRVSKTFHDEAIFTRKAWMIVAPIKG